MKKIVVGVIILLFGIFLLLNNLGLFPFGIYRIVVSWQMLLIAIGAILVFDDNSNNKNTGIVLIGVGLIFLLPRIFHNHDLMRILFPVLIIIGGIYFIIRAVTKRNNPFQGSEPINGKTFQEMPFVETSAIDREYIKREYVFSGSKERWTYRNLKKIEIDAVFSGVEVDLLDVELSPEVDTVFIKVTSVFSGVTLFIPDNWNVLIQKTGVFGGFTDKRAPQNIPLGGKVVVLELEAIFGGGEIKFYE